MIEKQGKKTAQWGYDALPTGLNPQETIGAIHAYRPDLILMNTNTLTPYNTELLKQTRTQFQGPILYLVDKDGEEILQRARIDGPFCFIKNTLKGDALRSTVEMALYKYTLDQHLRESEERYQIISEMVSDASFSVKINSDQSYIVNWVSDSFFSLTGYTLNDFNQAGGWVKIIHPDNLSEFEQMFQVLQSGKPGTGEYRFYHRSGRLIWLQIFCQIKASQEKQFDYIYGAIRNTTKIKLTKEILYRDQEELRALFNNAPIGMAITSLDHRLSSVNTTFCSMIGYSFRELISMPIINITHPDDIQEKTRRFQGLINGHYTGLEMEKRLITRDKKILYVTMHASLIRDSLGAPLHIITQYVDNSLRRGNEKILEESYVTLSTVLGSLDAYVTVIDKDTCEILFANRKTTETFGNVVGKKCWKVLQVGQKGPCTYCNNQELLLPDGSPGKPIVEEDFYHKINAWVEIRSQAVRWIDNRLVRLEIATDITRHKRMEVEMHLLNGSLSESLSAMQERNRQITLLNKLSETLQSCQSTNQAYPIIQKTLKELFNEHPGNLLVWDTDSQVPNVVCLWGTPLYSQESKNINFCPCFQEKKTILSLEPEEAKNCPCISPDLFNVPFLCAPILDEEKPFGLLHIEFHDTRPYDPLENHLLTAAAPHQLSLKEWEDLVMMTASQVTLSLTNIRLKERLQIEAIRDPLTGLFNRRYMEESLEREFRRAQRHNHSVGVMMIDIDHFKNYNDQYGHIVGDLILNRIGAHIIAHFRGEDIACRYGGDEIVIILPEASLEETYRRAVVINEATRYVVIEHQCFEQDLTVSVGVAVFPNHGKTSNEVLAAADAALYQAKLTGRNRVVISQVS